MKKKNLVQNISIGGLLTAITVLLQAAPVFMPAIGMLMSTLSILPIAIAAMTNIFLGFGVMVASALLLLIISIQESMILIFTTGILGFTLGALLFRRREIITVLASSFGLVFGMLVLTYVIGVPGFAKIASRLKSSILVFAFVIFSIVYVSLWMLFLMKFERHMKKLKQFKIFSKDL